MVLTTICASSVESLASTETLSNSYVEVDSLSTEVYDINGQFNDLDLWAAVGVHILTDINSSNESP